MHMKIKLKYKIIKQLKVEESINKLGVYINPSLNWNDECECVKKKLIKSINKIIRAEIKTYQVHMCFIIHMLTNMHFGCEIVNFNEKQIK